MICARLKRFGTATSNIDFAVELVNLSSQIAIGGFQMSYEVDC